MIAIRTNYVYGSLQIALDMGGSLNAILSIAALEESSSLAERDAQVGTMKANAHKIDRIKGQLEREKSDSTGERRLTLNCALPKRNWIGRSRAFSRQERLND